MATIRRGLVVPAPPEKVWLAFQDFGAPHRRPAPGFVTDTKLEGAQRVVTFANGVIARERLVTSDDAERRLVYAVTDSDLLVHHNASFQVFADPGGARVVWIADILPDAAAAPIGGMMDAGVASMQQHLSQLA